MSRESKNNVNVVWLASWYPNKLHPFDGDFVQRHARALALYQAVTVIHVLQQKDTITTTENIAINTTGNITEIILYFPFKTTGNEFIDKIRFNRKYVSVYKKFLLSYFKEAGIPRFIHVHVPMKAGLIALWLKRKFEIPYLLTEHYDIYNNSVADAFKTKSRSYRYFTKLVFKNALSLISVSRQIAEQTASMVFAKPYKVICNTVDTSLFFYVAQIKEDARFRFIHVSNMAPKKNAAGIIHAFVQLCKTTNRCELVFVGAIDSVIFQLAQSTSLVDKAIFFTGELSYPDVALEMQKAQSLVLFSTTENMPCVILEALCCGLPVISTKTGGIPEVVDDQNGMLVQVDDEAGLQKAMYEMITGYSKFSRVKIAEKASERFSYATIGAAISDLYSSLFPAR